MFQRILLHIVAGIAALWIAVHFIPNVELHGSTQTQTLLIAGLVLGIMNAVVKPILNLVTFPIRILTLGLSSFLLNLLLVFAVDVLFPELDMKGFTPLLWTTLVLSGVSIPLSLLSRGKI